MNESSMTGESVPIPKEQIPSTNEPMDINDPKFKKYLLYEGTKVFTLKYRIIDLKFTKDIILHLTDDYVLAVALKTGFSSFKG